MSAKNRSTKQFNCNTKQFNCNLTDIIYGKECCLISDPEGYKLCKLAGPKYIVHGDRIRQDKTFIVLGDMIDSAMVYDGNIFNDIGPEFKDLKSFNLANLLEAHKNKSIHVLFGNRDLNKLKVLPLTMIDGNQDWFKDGKTYLDIARNLNDNINSQKYMWKIPNLSAWYPFWSNPPTLDSIKAKQDLWGPGRKSSAETKMTCFERFALIFGADTTVGTMSAHNLLYCIPREVLGEEKFKTTFLTFTKNINSDKPLDLNKLFDYMPGVDNHNIPLFDELNLAAALVLTVFHRLLIKPELLKSAIQLKYDCLLYKLYKSSRSYFCAHANTKFGEKEYLSLFSHGGMTSHFTPTKLAEFNGLLEDVTFTDNLKKMSGGFYKNGIEDQAATKLTEFCQVFNTKFKKMLCAIIDLDYSEVNKQIEPTKEMLAMMLLTAATACGNHKTGPKTELNTKLFSPILPGIDDYRKHPISCSDKDLIQFIGHAPNGFGVSVDLYTNTNSKDSYLVNLDISNTIFSNPIADQSHLKDLFINVELDAMSVYINGDIYTTQWKSYRYKHFDILTDTFRNHLKTTSATENKTYQHGIDSISSKYLSTAKTGFDYTPNTPNKSMQKGGSRKRRSSSKLSKSKSKKRTVCTGL